MAEEQINSQSPISLSIKHIWAVEPPKVADTVVSEYVSAYVRSARLERHMAALEDKERVYTGILGKFAAEGRNDKQTQAAARELRDIRTNKLLAQERLSHNRDLRGALEDVLNDDEIRPHADRRIDAINRFAREVINDPNTDDERRTFFKGFRDVFGPRRLK